MNTQLPLPSAFSPGCHLDIPKLTGKPGFWSSSKICFSCSEPVSVNGNLILPGALAKASEPSLPPRVLFHPSSNPPANPVCSAFKIHPGSGSPHHPRVPPWPTPPSPLSGCGHLLTDPPVSALAPYSLFSTQQNGGFLKFQSRPHGLHYLTPHPLATSAMASWASVLLP